MNKTAIVIIDMVNGFIKEGAMHDQGIMAIVPHIQKLVEETVDADLIVFEDSHQEDCAEFSVFPKHCVAGTSESVTIDELAYLKDKAAVIPKNSTNGFFEFINHAQLRPYLDYDRYIIVGCCTDICVMQLAMSLQVYGMAVDRPYQIIVPQDCVSTYDASVHPKAEYETMAFQLMKNAGIQIV